MATTPPQQPLPSMARIRLRRRLESELRALKPETLQDVVCKALRNNPVVVDVFQNLLLVPKSDVVLKYQKSAGGNEEGDDEEYGDEQEDKDEEEDRHEGEDRDEEEDGDEEDRTNSNEQLEEDAEVVLKAKAILRAEAMLPYAEQRKFTIQEILEEIVSMSIAMIQSRDRPMGVTMPAYSNATASVRSKQQQNHKRSLSAYSDIPTQPHQKKPSTTVKRYATGPTSRMCKNCEQEFDVTENFSEACNYHDGDLGVNFESSTWDDWNEDTWGPIDERLEEDFPEGFKWDCCEGDGNARGCQTGWHQK